LFIITRLGGGVKPADEPAGNLTRDLRAWQVDHWAPAAGACWAKAFLMSNVIAHSRGGAVATTVQVMPALIRTFSNLDSAPRLDNEQLHLLEIAFHAVGSRCRSAPSALSRRPHIGRRRASGW
jgi:hypothetical protein